MISGLSRVQGLGCMRAYGSIREYACRSGRAEFEDPREAVKVVVALGGEFCLARELLGARGEEGARGSEREREREGERKQGGGRREEEEGG
eukprot:2006940-Rhodomonas_salina.1